MNKKANMYHGSPDRLKVLKPKNWHGDPGIPLSIFGTKFKDFALVYAGKKWSDLDINQEVITNKGKGKHILTEMRPNAFKDIFKGKSGYLHTMSPKGFKERNTHEHISTKKVRPHTIEKINDTYKALKNEGVVFKKFNPKSSVSKKIIKFRLDRMNEMTPDKREQYKNWIQTNAHPSVINAMFHKKASIDKGEMMNNKKAGVEAETMKSYLANKYKKLDMLPPKPDDRLFKRRKQIGVAKEIGKLPPKELSEARDANKEFNRSGKRMPKDNLIKYSLSKYTKNLDDNERVRQDYRKQDVKDLSKGKGMLGGKPIGGTNKTAAALTFQTAKHLALMAAIVKTRMLKGTVTPQTLRMTLEEARQTMTKKMK